MASGPDRSHAQKPGDTAREEGGYLHTHVPPHPANTGNDLGMYGKITRNLSPAQSKRPPAMSVHSRPANPGTEVYTIDPLGKSSKNPFLQKGKWRPARNTIDPPALARNWGWCQEREVKSSLAETAYDYSSLKPGWRKPTWALHFGLNATRPTFGKMCAPLSAHAAPATLAHEMSMDKELFSPFRTTVEMSLATPPPRSLPVWTGNHWEPDGSLMSASLASGPSQSSKKLRTAEGGVPDPRDEHACLLHNLLGCMLCATSERARRSRTVNVQRIPDSRPTSRGGSLQDPSFAESRKSFEMQVEPSDVSSMLSAVDFGRVASPASGRQPASKLIHARSCMALDGTERSLLILPDKWGPIKHLIKDEVQARVSMHDKIQRQVLSESPKHIMRHLHAQMRNHPDSPWQPICFPVVQAGH